MTVKKDLAHDQRAHATYGPSSMKRIINCPASVYLGKDLPEPESGSAAKEGSLAHECAELMLKARLEGEPYPRLKDLPPVYKQEMRRHGIAYADYIYGEIEPYLHLPHVNFIEEKVVLDEDLDIWGTADFTFIYKDEDGKVKLMIIDYKYGQLEINTQNNPQLITYALAANESLGEGKVVSATCHIVQPRTHHETPPAEYSIDELNKVWLPKIKKAVNLVESWFKQDEVSNEELVKHQKAGEWCRFCKVQKHGKCEPYRKLNQGRLKVLFQEHGDKLMGPKAQAKLPEEIHALIPDEDRSFIALNAGSMKAFIDAVKRGVVSDHTNNKPVKGSKMVQATPNRAWVSNEEEVVKGLKELGIEETHKESVKKLRSLSDIESEIGKGKLGHLTRTLNPKYNLVSEDDVTPEAKFGLDRQKLLKSVMKKNK